MFLLHYIQEEFYRAGKVQIKTIHGVGPNYKKGGGGWYNLGAL